MRVEVRRSSAGVSTSPLDVARSMPASASLTVQFIGDRETRGMQALAGSSKRRASAVPAALSHISTATNTQDGSGSQVSAHSTVAMVAL